MRRIIVLVLLLLGAAPAIAQASGRYTMPIPEGAAAANPPGGLAAHGPVTVASLNRGSKHGHRSVTRSRRSRPNERHGSGRLHVSLRCGKSRLLAHWVPLRAPHAMARIE